MMNALKFDWLLLGSLVLYACRPVADVRVNTESTAGGSQRTTIPTVQPYSPILVATPTPDSTKIIAPSTPTPYILEANFQDGTTVEEMVWQGDDLITNAAPDMRSTRVKFKPSTKVWQREEILPDDLQVGDWLSIFAVRTDQILQSTVLITMPAPDSPYAKQASYVFDHTGIGQIASIASTVDNRTATTSLTLTVDIDNVLIPLKVSPTSRLFRQHEATLADIEVGSDVSFAGTLWQTGETMLADIEQALILKPNDNRAQLVELNCSTVDNAVHCIDDYLGVEFTLPVAWAPSASELRRNSFGGFSYSYQFSNEGIGMHGVSANYVLGVGGWLYRGENPLEFCRERLNAAHCEEVQPNVVLLIGIPSVRTLCSWQQPIFNAPKAIVLVSIPDHPTINGLVIDVEFMSESLRHELTALTPDRSASSPCRLEDWVALSDRYQLLVNQIIEGTIDPESQHNLDNLRVIATSLQGIFQYTPTIK